MDSRVTGFGATGYAEITRRLGEVDWSFGARSASDPLEGIHPYPAKFIPQIPGTLLDILPVPDGSTVVDPFVGSGTTLVESQRRGIRSTGVDINPIACLISRVKTGPDLLDLADVARAVAVHAQGIEGAVRPEIPNVDHWFHKLVQERLAALRTAIDSAPSEFHDALNLALSAIVVRVSRQDSDTRYAAVDKNFDPESVIALFEAAAKRVQTALNCRDGSRADALVVEADAQRFEPSPSSTPIGAVITSPPYPNAYEYWLYHKYRMYWLGRDPVAVRESEIGARPHFFKKNPHTAESFKGQMSNVLTNLDSALVSGGWVCVVVGRSRIRGVDVDNAEIVRDVGRRMSWDLVAQIERIIAPTRKAFNLSHARIKTESIVVFCKP